MLVLASYFLRLVFGGLWWSLDVRFARHFGSHSSQYGMAEERRIQPSLVDELGMMTFTYAVVDGHHQHVTPAIRTWNLQSTRSKGQRIRYVHGTPNVDMLWSLLRSNVFRNHRQSEPFFDPLAYCYPETLVGFLTRNRQRFLLFVYLTQ